MKLKIGICGSSSVGKSTLVKALTKYLQDEDIEIITEITREVSKSLPINSSAQNYDETQMIITGIHLGNLIKERFLSDRCLIDSFVMTNYLWQAHKCSIGVRELAHIALDKGIRLYDHIFYIPIEARVRLEDDGVRSTDVEFRKDINHQMKMLISNLKMEGRGDNIHEITGSVEERAQAVKRIITNGK